MDKRRVSTTDPQRSQSPFDALMGADGRWSARDLQTELGYAQWRNFEKGVLAARESITVNDGVSAGREHIADASKSSPQPNGGDRMIPDYRLTRYGAYRVMLECDGSKPEVAAAKHYFAVRTREAETRPALKNRNLAIMEAMLYEIQATQDRVATLEMAQQEQQREQATITARVENLEGNHGWVAALGYAKLHGLVTETRYLQRVGMKATALARQRGIAVGQVDHPMFGKANTYPPELLAEAFAIVKPTRA